MLYALYIAKKTGHFSFISGCVIRMVKCSKKEDWYVILRLQLQLKTTLYHC